MTLDKSGSGATLYMEPKPAMDLNNRKRTLEGAAAREEQRVLARACAQVVAVLPDIERALGGVLALDLATARARHAGCATARAAELRDVARAQAVRVRHAHAGGLGACGQS